MNSKKTIADDEDEDLCVSHPPYFCDGGCGKKMGDQDDCQRICDDCGSDTSSKKKKKKKKLVIVDLYQHDHLCLSCGCGLNEDDEKYYCNSREEFVCDDCLTKIEKCDDESCDCCHEE